MRRTVNQIIDAVQAHRYASLTDAAGLEYMNRVYAEIVSVIPQVYRSQMGGGVNVAFTAGEQEKPVPSPFLNQIDYAVWTPVSGSKSQIPVATVESINRGTNAQPGIWRGGDPAAPEVCYIMTDETGQQVGFNSKVPAGTLTLYGSSLPPVLTGGEFVPVLPTDQAFVEGVSYYYMADRRSPNAASHFQAYGLEIAKIKRWVMTLEEGFQNEERNVR